MFARFVARMEDKRLPKCAMFGELVGGAGCAGRPGKRVDGMFPGRPQSFRHQRQPVDGCSPGRGGMAQNGRTRGGTFHGEMDRCRESQGWTTACSGMPERDGVVVVSHIQRIGCQPEKNYFTRWPIPLVVCSTGKK